LYDPLALAVEALDSMGLPVPAGYTVQEVPAGSMGEGRIATVDYDTLTISVDVAAFGEMAGFPPEAFVTLLMVTLQHEYNHTPEYGGGPADFCTHFAMGEYDLAFMCKMISGVQQDAAEALCAVYSDWSQWLENLRARRNAICPGSSPPVPSCNAC